MTVDTAKLRSSFPQGHCHLCELARSAADEIDKLRRDLDDVVSVLEEIDAAEDMGEATWIARNAIDTIRGTNCMCRTEIGVYTEPNPNCPKHGGK